MDGLKITLLGGLIILIGSAISVYGTYKTHKENRDLASQNTDLLSRSIHKGTETTINEGSKTRHFFLSLFVEGLNSNISSEKFLSSHKNHLEDYKYPVYVNLLGNCKKENISKNNTYKYVEELYNLNQNQLEIMKWSSSAPNSDVLDISDFKEIRQHEIENSQNFIATKQDLRDLEVRGILVENSGYPDFNDIIELEEYGKIIVQLFDLKEVNSIDANNFNIFLGRK